MPTPSLQSIADKSKKSLSDIERYWADAKEQLNKDELTDEDYAYITSIVKKRAGIDESFSSFLKSKLSMKEFIDIIVED